MRVLKVKGGRENRRKDGQNKERRDRKEER